MIETPLSGENNSHAFQNKKILLLSESVTLGRMMKEAFEAAGATVFWISSVESLKLDWQSFDMAIDLWGLEADEIPNPSQLKGWWERTMRRSSIALEARQKISQSIIESPDRRVLWVVVTPFGGSLGANESPCFSASGAVSLALSRCLQAEHADAIEALYIDVEPNESPKRLISWIFDELSHDKKTPEIGYSKGKRFALQWRIDDISDKPQSFELSPESLVLAVGGARGITASICRSLAHRYRCKFILVGRSQLKTSIEGQSGKPLSFETARSLLIEHAKIHKQTVQPAQIECLAWEHVWDTERLFHIEQLKEHASSVEYHAVDIAQIDDVCQLVQTIHKRYGKIDLVIQGGGGTLEKSIVDYQPDSFIKGMQSKALGTTCLFAALENIEVGTLINLSSISGRWGNRGQGAYAAGHEIAASLVSAMRTKRPGRLINIFYGPWLNVGMALVGDRISRIRYRGANFITEESGAGFFINEFRLGDNRNVAFCGAEILYRSLLKTQAPLSCPPLLDSIQRVRSGIVEGVKVFDPNRDRFVSDHCFLPSQPVVPGVVSLELMAQTASALVPNQLALTDCEDVLFLRTGDFPNNKPRQFRARAKIKSLDEDAITLECEVFTSQNGAAMEETIYSRCNLRFGKQQPSPKPTLLLANAGFGNNRIDATPLWKTQRFKHSRKGMFRNILALTSITRDGSVGEVYGQTEHGFGEKPFTGNPIRLDGIFFLSGLPITLYYKAWASYISHIKSIRFFASDSTSEICFVRSRIHKISEKEAIGNIESMDKMGRVMERITELGRAVQPLQEGIELIEPIWNSIKNHPVQSAMRKNLGYEGRLILAEISISLVQNALETNDSAALHEYLSPEELKRFHSFANPKRKAEWLAGRIAAKSAVQMYLASNRLTPSETEILQAPDNPCYVSLSNLEINQPIPFISISHSGKRAIAAATEHSGIGVDVQEITTSITDFADDICSNEELSLLDCDANSLDVALSHVWAMKEASIKATGAYQHVMKELTLTKAERNGDYIVAGLQNPSGIIMKSVSVQIENYIYAVSIADSLAS